MGLEEVLNNTWSCLKNEQHHCGQCRACKRRQEAFKYAGIKDNTIYLNK
jgi:7-cyano-7-deazaguanine synthase